MTRRERLMATLRGAPVDRPAVSFYEIDGYNQNPDDPHPYNVFNHPSWRPLLELARARTDVIVMRGVAFPSTLPDPADELARVERREENGRVYTAKTIRVGGRALTSRTRRDRDVNTVWTEEHLLKDADDLRAFLDLPPPPAAAAPDVTPILELERRLGDNGIVLIDTADPLCLAASLFDMAEYTVVASTEPELFHRLLERFAASLRPRTEAVARALPGRLWRIYGPEYASPPYLRPELFREYVVRYDRPMTDAIRRHGGFPRVHCHGRLKDILDDIVAMGATALDPIEPPPQGDVELGYVRQRYGRDLALFGNLEASDLENLPTPQFREKIRRALDEGTAGSGRGFVLMPSACPYGRVLSPLALRNYEAMVEWF